MQTGGMLNMTQPEFLTRDELVTLTNRHRAGHQASWLRDHGIPYRLDGTRVIVSRVHTRAWLEGRAPTASGGLNWAAARA